MTEVATVAHNLLKVGKTVCVNGPRGPVVYSCGQIADLYSAVSSSTSKGLYPYATYSAQGGDSGAPVFFNNIAYGIHRGDTTNTLLCVGNCETFTTADQISKTLGVYPVLQSSPNAFQVLRDWDMSSSNAWRSWTPLGGATRWWSPSYGRSIALRCSGSSCSVYQDKLGGSTAEVRFNVKSRIYCPTWNGSDCKVEVVLWRLAPGAVKLTARTYTIERGAYSTKSVISAWNYTPGSLRAEIYNKRANTTVYIDYYAVEARPN